MSFLSKAFKSVIKLPSKLISGVNKATSSVFGNEIGSALTMAALAAGAVYSGGALAGAAGLGVTGASALASTAGTGAVVSGGLAGYQAGVAETNTEKQLAAQQEAENKAAESLKQQELIRKNALLAEQSSVTARSNAARNVRNNLYGLSNSKLGSNTETLG